MPNKRSSAPVPIATCLLFLHSFGERAGCDGDNDAKENKADEPNEHARDSANKSFRKDAVDAILEFVAAHLGSKA